MLSKIKEWIGYREHREISQIRKVILPQIDNHIQWVQHKTQLYEVSDELRMRWHRVENDEEPLILAFALVKEAVKRVLGVTMHDTQLIGGWMLCKGKIPEILTEEGKTLVSLLPAYWFGLQGKGVHMITVNEYLAKRDYEQMSEVFQFLGLSVGLNLVGLDEQEKKKAYRQDITYGTCTEFGFDYLRDHRVLHPDQRVQRELTYAIVDEMDNILSDEARTPFIIADKVKAGPDLYYICKQFVRGLQEVRDYEVDLESKQVMFTKSKIKKIEEALKKNNLYELEHTTIYHYLLQSLRAKVLMQRDVDYIVTDSQVYRIDTLTGRILEGRFSDGLQQAIEAKENVPLSEESRTYATITVQKFFDLYNQTVDVTGTMGTDGYNETTIALEPGGKWLRETITVIRRGLA